MNIKNYIKKNIYLIFFLVILFLVATAYFKTIEGFNKTKPCNSKNCTGDYEFVGGKCLVKCDKIWKGSSILRNGSWSCKKTGYGTGEQVISRNNVSFTKNSC